MSIKAGFRANIDIYEHHADGQHLIIVAAVADIAPSETLVQPTNFMKHLLRSKRSTPFDVERWMEDTKRRLDSIKERASLDRLRPDFETVSDLLFALAAVARRNAKQ